MRNYTETNKFDEELKRLEMAGITKEELEKYKVAMSKFDENGMDIGTNYSNCVLAFIR